jgi:4-amino-4-deoxy-L-arabinose transferase-like glycosyltransferase
MRISNHMLAFLDDKYNLGFLITLFLGVFIRLKYLFIESVWHDEATYMWQASQLLNPSYIGVRIREPVVLVVMAFNKLFADPFIAGRITALAFALLGIILIYYLGIELKDRFVGLMAAMLLTFHHLFWFLNEKMILDAPLTTMFIFIAYLLFKVEKQEKSSSAKSVKQIIEKHFLALTLGSVLVLTFLTKGAGILALVILLLYFVFTRRMSVIRDTKVVYSIVVPVVFLVLGSAVYYLLFGKFVLNTFFVYLFSMRSITQPFNFVGILPFVLSAPILILTIIGMFFAIMYRRKTDIYLLLWFWVYFIFFSVNIGGPLPRYILPILPAAILFSVLALDEIRIYFKRLLGLKLPRVVFIVIIAIVCFSLFNQGQNMILDKEYSYLGFEEAGDWLSYNLPDGAILFAGSPAAIRLFSGFEYINVGYAENYGDPNGQLYYGMPKEVNDFEVLINQYDDVYLEIDVWEYANQGWAYPLNQEKVDYLYSLGFEVVHVVEKTIPTDAGLQKIPVVFIFHRK